MKRPLFALDRILFLSKPEANVTRAKMKKSKTCLNKKDSMSKLRFSMEEVKVEAG